jgi:hypothetical protein
LVIVLVAFSPLMFGFWKGRNAPMLKVIPPETWKTAAAAGGILPLGMVIVFVVAVTSR